MLDLTQTLEGYDLALLRVIANRWDVDLTARDAHAAAGQLVAGMHSPTRVADVWGRLDESQRQALQTLLGAGGKMAMGMFKRMFGDIRTMGPERLAREQPYLNPVSLAEALYYRGLIATTFDSGAAGVQSFIYVPDDLIPLLPTHRTGYKLDAPPTAAAPVVSRPEPANIRLADSSLVDDLTTFLAFCQHYAVAPVDSGGVLSISPEAQQAVKPFFLGSSTAARLGLIIALSAELELASMRDNAYLPQPTARRWLELRRADQQREVAEAWRRSTFYNELLYTPGLKFDPSAGAPNDPLLVRQTVLNFLEDVPADEWWRVDEFVAEIKETEPDFQRPSGDYDSWYIRDGHTDEFLRGFGTWDRVEGALLRFTLTGVMAGLGLIDTAEKSTACRLTASGRALIGLNDWPQAIGSQPPITIHDDGTIEVPGAANRYDRFQLSRFCEWLKAGEPFVYRLSATSLGQAAGQHLHSEHILTFLQRASADVVPAAVEQMIQNWAQSDAQPTIIERLVVLQTPTPELLRTIQTIPDLRRYLAAPLGPTAVAVRADQWQALAAALQTQGIPVETDLD